MPLLLLAALLPGLYWEGNIDTAPALKQAGILRVYVPADRLDAWRQAGFTAVAFNPAAASKLTPPGVQYRINEASATREPWVDANGWRFLREGARSWYYELPQGAAALAAAEAYAYGVDAVVRPDPADLDLFGRMLAFLRGIDRPRMPGLANIGIIDDGSEETGEVLNLLARRNLLFRIIRAPDPRYDLVVRIGSPEYPKSEAADPYSFAQALRQKLGDERRLLRIYGSEVVLGRLTGEPGRARLHLLNYGGRKIGGLRVRVRGEYAKGTLAAFGIENSALQDYTVADGGTEFTIPEMLAYAAIDLTASSR